MLSRIVCLKTDASSTIYRRCLASRLRALDLIGVETTEFVVRVGDVEQLVEVKLRVPQWGLMVAVCLPDLWALREGA